jgi:hypothetical protein
LWQSDVATAGANQSPPLAASFTGVPASTPEPGATTRANAAAMGTVDAGTHRASQRVVLGIPSTQPLQHLPYYADSPQHPGS